jgi:hypothetical protein
LLPRRDQNDGGALLPAGLGRTIFTAESAENAEDFYAKRAENI